jgi:hypothetical protein
MVSILNPVLLCIKYKSFQCLKYLCERFSVRPSIKEADIVVRRTHGEYPFRQWALPVLLKVKDVDSLSYLLKQPGFILST